jgi:hypothetical protein
LAYLNPHGRTKSKLEAIMIRNRSWPLAAALVLMPAAPADAQIAVVTVRSVNGVLADFRYIAPLIKAEAQVQQLDAFLKEHPRLKALEGLDANKPCGLYVNWAENPKDVEDFNFPVVFFLPVTDEKKFLALPEELGFTPVPAKDGRYRLTVFGLPQLHLRFAHGHVFIAPKAEWLDGTVPNPADFLPAGARDNLLVASLRVEHFPPAAGTHLSALFDQLQKQINEELGEDDRRPGETDTEYRRRRVARRNADSFSAAMTQVTTGLGKQLREVTARVALDPQAHTLSLELAVVPRAGGPPSNFAAYLGGARSRFSGLARKAPFGTFIHLPASKGGEFIPDLGAIQRAARDLVGSRNRDAATKFMQVLIPTIAADGLDCFLTVRPSGEGFADPIILGGLKVRNGRQLDHLARDTFRDLTANEKKDIAVEWNHSAHAGARIHKLQLAGTNENIYVAIRDDVVFVAAGKDPLPFLRQGLDEFDKSTPAPTPFLELAATSALFRHDLQLKPLVEKLVPPEQQDELFARVSLRGGEDLRLRLELSDYLLTLFAVLGAKQP